MLPNSFGRFKVATARELVELSNYFTLGENWGDIDKVDHKLVELLIDLRSFINKPLVIHVVYEKSGHATNSMHYKGKAADFHFKGIPFREAIELVEEWLTFGFKFSDESSIEKISDYVGLGLYPFWNSPGFHLDTRGKRARWSFDKNRNQVSYEIGKEAANGI